MADKAISELNTATQVTPTDLFVLEQSGTAKKLTGQTLENWLLSFADGHGGIHNIEKVSTSGLKDTYRITLADTSTVDFVVTNGKSISSVKQTSASGLTRTYTIAFNDGTNQKFTVTDGRSVTNIEKTGAVGLTDTFTISYNDGTTSTFTVKNGRGIDSFRKVSTSGLTDTYEILYNDGTTNTFTVTNGAKGDKGDNTFTHIKFASQKPTEVSHSMGDIPDNWIGFYWGNSSDAPTDWTQYVWFQIKGEKGDTGVAATLVSSSVEYQVSDSGTITPSGDWSATVPMVDQGKYLWTRTTNTFNTGSPVVSYSVTRMGLDGSGSVTSVASISPDENGNVPLTASDVGALPIEGGDITGELTAPLLAIYPLKGYSQAIRFLDEDGDLKTTIYPGNNGNFYVRQIDPNTQKSERFKLPELTPGITADATYKILTSKEPVSIAEGGTGANTASQALTNLGGISIVKVWENARPNDEFPGQDITVDLANDYKFFIVSCKRSNNMQTRTIGIINYGAGSPIVGVYNVQAEGETRICSRDVLVSTGGYIRFGDAYRKVPSATTPELLNSALIPTEIYGIKGVPV
jgi:hypothetical protein